MTQETTITEDLRYPIGKYAPQEFSEKQKEEWLADIKFLPQAIENAILNLDQEQLQTPYRDGGWTIHQVVHHLADSHMNAYIRVKLGYTENTPAIKPYEEQLWAETADVKELPLNISITLLHALHTRFYTFLNSFTNEDWQKKVFHPQHNKEITLWHLLGMYSWHGRHHTAHVTELKKRKNW